MKAKIDLNLDAGESSEALASGREERLYALVTRVNIACGGHAGDETTMTAAIELAQKYNLKIGAHPSYPDKANFGRVAIDVTPAEVAAFTESQIRALKKLCDARGVPLCHVKAHGALYNQLAASSILALAFAEGVAAVDAKLSLIGLAGSPALSLWSGMGFTVLGEAFADRRYRSDGTLVKRGEPGAVIEEPEAAVQQVESLLARGEVHSIDGKVVKLRCETVCVHGDNPAAETLLAAIRARPFPES